MNLYVDMGNTSTVFGYKRSKTAYKDFRIPTSDIFKSLNFRRSLLAEFEKTKISKDEINDIVICSVVPKAQAALKKNLKAIFKQVNVLIIGKNILLDIKNNYKIPEQVGLDRLVNALAVRKMNRLPALIVDFGTAITIDAVSAKGEYLGGVIVPGINLSLMALHQNTALLPKLKAARPRKIMGTDTGSSILSGVFYGYASLVDGLVSKLKKEIWKNNPDVKVIATGGHLDLIKELCTGIKFYDPFLTIKGIEIAYFDSK